jgi:hypothetical protein
MGVNGMKKAIVIGIICLFVGLGFQSAFAVEHKELPVKGKLVETSVRIHNSRGITPYTLKLTEKESDEVDRIFDNLNVSLDSAETGEEIDEIYDDAVESLYELGLFPRMTIKEAKQLVNGKSVKSRPGNLDNGNENFNCQISGTLSNSNCYHGTLGSLFRGRYLFLFINILVYLFYGRNNLPYFKGRILEIIFGTNFIIYDAVDYYPAAGWVHSNGSNGVIKWEGRFYGNIDYREREEENPPGYKFKEGIYIGVTEFNGVFIDSLYDNKVNFLGNAEHVSLSYDPSWP